MISSSSAGILIGILTLTIGIAVYCSQVVVWYDAGLYHVQAIKWLSEYGLVPGLALIHDRLGFLSAWFTLSAAFNHGLLLGRTTSLPGGFCLLMLLIHCIIAFVRITKQQGRNQDMFIATASLLAIPVILIRGMPNSPSPDLPVIILVIVTAWTILIITDLPRENHDLFDNSLNVSLAPLILAAGAISIKLSALPLLVVACIFYLFNKRLNFRKAAAAFLIILLFLAPLAAGGFITSGCAFFPFHLFCADLPWSLGAIKAAAVSQIIKEWARWGGRPTPEDATSLNWIIPWFKSEIMCVFLLLLSVISIVISLFLSAKRKVVSHNCHIMAIAIFGMAFMLYSSPTWRFGLGYLVILPALMLANNVKLCPPQFEIFPSIKRVNNFGVIGTVTAVLLILHIYIVPRSSFKLLDESVSKKWIISDDNPHFNFLLPPRIWTIGAEMDEGTGAFVAFENVIIRDSTEDFTYYRPDNPVKSDTCWDSPLPCAPDKLKDVKLRDQIKGYAKGFKIIKHTPDAK
jgi:hypothetical protein